MKKSDILNDIVTTSESTQIYDIADSTLRIWIAEGIIPSQMVRKSGNTWVIVREALEEVLKKKNLLTKTIDISGEKLELSCFGYKSKSYKAWYENDEVKEFLENLPSAHILPLLGEVMKDTGNINMKLLCVDNNKTEINNAFYPKEKVMLITLVALTHLVYDSLKQKGLLIEAENVKKYANKHEITW